MALLIPATGAAIPAALPQARGWPGRWLLLALALLLTLHGLAGGADAPPLAAAEVARNVKAAFLYKFLGYVEFGDGVDAAGPLVVGVIEADDIADELNRITAGRQIGARAVAVRVLHEGDTLAGLHMLFVGSSAERPGAILRAAQQAGALGVTEHDDGLQLGGAINFVLVEDRVRFEVSLPAAEKSRLKLSSRLLSLAYHVNKGGS